MKKNTQNQYKILKTFVVLCLIAINLSVSSNNIDKTNKPKIEIPKLGISSIQSLTIELIEPGNMTTITNGTELLFRLSGSLDKKVFYHWSFEIINDSFTVIDEYFIINAPLLPQNESLLYLQIFSSENSSISNSTWITKQFYFQYDFQAPQYSISHLNNSKIASFTIIEIYTSEGLYSSYYKWNVSNQFYLNGNTTAYNISVNLSEGTYSLELHFEDQIGNRNHTTYIFEIAFAIQSNPSNESIIKTGKIINLDFSDPYNTLFAWDSNSFSGYLDPTPAGEGTHILHINVEKEPNVFEMWNFTYTVDNTPIVITLNPTSGFISPSTNLSITVNETPENIWGTIQFVDPLNYSQTQDLFINGSDPYWVILPELYGEINITVHAQDIAENIGTASSLFNISFGVVEITPQNNSLAIQGEIIDILLNHNEWRTILFNQVNTYNTTYLEPLPLKSGVHNITIYLEDINRRWTSEFYQWFVIPLINLTSFYNGSYVQTSSLLNFSFGETIQQANYTWGNDTYTVENTVSFITTTMDDWSNKTLSIGTFYIYVKGTDDIWNNQTYVFTRDNNGISINLQTTINDTIINTPFLVHITFNETAREVLYSWDGQTNNSIFNTPTVSLDIPLNISTNPHTLQLYVRDEAQNWNTKQFQFYTGTGLYEIDPDNGTLIRGGSNIKFNMTVDPLRVGYEWQITSDNSTIIAKTWLNTINESIPVPLVDNQTYLIFHYDLFGGTMYLNETKQYLIDSTLPNVTIVGSIDPFLNKTLVTNATTRLIDPEMVAYLLINENLTNLKVVWNNDTIIFNQPALLQDRFNINFETLTKINGKGNLTVQAIDLVNNYIKYIWYFEFDNELPELIQAVPGNLAQVKPNSTIQFTYNKSLYKVDYNWMLNNEYLVNDTILVSNDTFTLNTPVEDGTYTLKLSVFDTSGNKQDELFTYRVDGSPPSVTFSLTNNSYYNSHEQLLITISEAISNQSYSFWNNETLTFINETSLVMNLTLVEGTNTLTLYVQDRIGNNRTYHQTYHIDDTPVSKPDSSISQGSWISDDTEMIRYYFDEQPQLVLANWNNGNNETLRIHFESLMTFGIDQTNGRYFVNVQIPEGNVFQDYSLELFIMDRANNWIKYNYSHFKVPTARDLTPYTLLVIFLIVILMYWKRKTITTKILVFKTKLVKETEELPEEKPKGDAIIYRKGEDSKKSKKKKG